VTFRNSFQRIALPLLLIAFTFNVQASTSNKWRLQFSGGADSDGVITMTILPKDGLPITVTASIEDGRGENDVAKDVVAALKAQLPEDQFHVERDDGEDVLVKKRFGAADFGIEVVSNTVKGVRINPDRE
jgi:hypothetical protein